MENGEVPIQGQHAHVQTADMSDLGIDRRRVAEWREARDAGQDVVEAALSEALSEERQPAPPAI